MRIAVTGGNGLVGSSIKAITHQYPEHEFVFLKRSDCELASIPGPFIIKGTRIPPSQTNIFTLL